jgi:hypothetical protein
MDESIVYVLVEAMSGSLNLFVNLVGNLGAVGLVFWLIIHTYKVTIPSLVKKFEDVADKARADFREEMRIQRKDFSEILEQHRSFFQQRVDAEHAQFERIAKMIQEMTVKEWGE